MKIEDLINDKEYGQLDCTAGMAYFLFLLKERCLLESYLEHNRACLDLKSGTTDEYNFPL